ncbi:hypothetical protein DEJ50_09085 [Streptomyces venezuelae]|uniref:Serine protease n=1 Tax=Streptomyces venezuelae TaxID=54571 RepID=A0A5P2D154_STRVZ|nr:trypsin-like peptidase domain-containing protein [Streptomyces venezuelae]QES47937.1 hypothetical protein DEJ50_09085 [Streptomyces venezuelae]
MEVTGELVRICDFAGRPRGSGFVADDRGTVITSHEAVAGLGPVVLHGAGERSCPADAAAVTLLASAGLALVRTEGLGVRPLPVAAVERVPAGAYVRLSARGWRQARVLGEAEVTYTATDRSHRIGGALELAIGTDGMDALRLGGETCGGPVLDAATGAVLAVLGTALHTEHRSGGFAVPLRAAAAADPGGPLAALLARNAATVPGYGADLNLAGALQLTGTTLGTALAEAAGAVERREAAEVLAAFTESPALVLALIGDPGTGRTTELAALAARRALGPLPSPTIWLRGADLAATDTSLADALTRALTAATRITAAAAPAPIPAPAPAPVPAATPRPDPDPVAAGPEEVAGLAAGAGRPLLVLLDAPEEMPVRLAQRLAEWTAGTARWLRENAVRMVVAGRPEYWERAGEFYPDGALYVPGRPAPRLPAAYRLGEFTPAEAEEARARYGIPADGVREPDGRHPLTLSLLAGIRAAEVTDGRPGRNEVFDAHLDLMCLRTAVRIAAGGADGPEVHGPGVRRLAARVAGRVHEAARRCLGPGQGELDRASFEELFPWRTGWAPAVLTEGLLVPAGAGYRFAHEEFADWLQAAHLDVPTALDTLVHRTAPAAGPPVPRHRIGPVLEALLLLPPPALTRCLGTLVAALDRPPAEAPDDRAWWAARLLREALLRSPDAQPFRPVLDALAAARGGTAEFGGWFWNRLRLPEPDRLELLRRMLPADHRCLDAVARRLRHDPQRVVPLLCDWFRDERRLHGRPGATVATATQALLHTHRRLAPDDLVEALVGAAHPRADELLTVLAEEEPPALCRAVDRWARDERPERRVAAAAYGPVAAAHLTGTAPGRALLRHAALALLDRPGDQSLHGAALGILLRDPEAREEYLPAALACPQVPASALIAAAEALPGRTGEIFDALRDRADGEVLRALAALTAPGPAVRAARFVREHLARHPQDAPHAAAFVDRRLDHGPAAGPLLRPLAAELLHGPPPARAALAAVLGTFGAEASRPLRGELLDALLDTGTESEPAVLSALLGAVAGDTVARGEQRTRELVRRTGRRLLGVPGGAAVFERRTVELAREHPPFGRLIEHWLHEEPREAAALLGPSARRMVETLAGTRRSTTIPRQR